MSERAYPIPRPASDDPRFTFGLGYEIGKTLEAAGFPPVHGADLVELQQALFRFIYAADEGQARKAAGVNEGQAREAAQWQRLLLDHPSLSEPRAVADVDPVSGRDYEEEAWQRAEAEREGREELAEAVTSSDDVKPADERRSAAAAGIDEGQARKAAGVESYWAVVYRGGSGEEFYIPDVLATSAEEASQRVADNRPERDVLNVMGPFANRAEAGVYREAWVHAGEFNQNQKLIADQSLITYRGWQADGRYIPSSGYGSVPFQPCADCLAPLTCQEGEEDRCP